MNSYNNAKNLQNYNTKYKNYNRLYEETKTISKLIKHKATPTPAKKAKIK